MNKAFTKLFDDFAIIASDLKEKDKHVVPIQFPSPSLNYACGNGGLIPGTVALFYGPESGGKTLIAQLALIAIQKQDPEAGQIVFDAEYTFNPTWFEQLGGDASRIKLVQSNDPTKIFDTIKVGGPLEKILDKGDVKINGIIIDSIRAIRWPTDNKDKVTDMTMGGSGSKFLTSALKNYIPVLKKHKLTTLLIQQVYEELDPMKAMNNPFKLPDGRALKHFCEYMFRVERLDTKAGRIEQGKTMTGSAYQVGHKVRVKCTKNKKSAPNRMAQFSLLYEKGVVNVQDEIFDMASSLGVIYHPISESTGNPSLMYWRYANFEQIKGEEGMKEWLKSHPELYTQIVADCDKFSSTIKEDDEADADGFTDALLALDE